MTCAGDINSEWFDKVRKVGVSAGASTPDYLIKEVYDKLRFFSSNNEEV